MNRKEIVQTLMESPFYSSFSLTERLDMVKGVEKILYEIKLDKKEWKNYVAIFNN
jgi:hypothetical protein